MENSFFPYGEKIVSIKNKKIYVLGGSGTIGLPVTKFLKDNSHPAGNDIEEAKKLYDNILKDKKSYDFTFISDIEYDDLIKKNIEKALYSKFNQNLELSEILKLTKNYKLNFYKQKIGSFLAKDLIKVRNMLNTN